MSEAEHLAQSMKDDLAEQERIIKKAEWYLNNVDLTVEEKKKFRRTVEDLKERLRETKLQYQRDMEDLLDSLERESEATDLGKESDDEAELVRIPSGTVRSRGRKKRW